MRVWFVCVFGVAVDATHAMLLLGVLGDARHQMHDTRCKTLGARRACVDARVVATVHACSGAAFYGDACDACYGATSMPHTP